MDSLDLHAKAIQLIELQQWHDHYFPCELSRPQKPAIANWYRLAKTALHHHFDEYGQPIPTLFDRKPDLPFMLALASCASIILSSTEAVSGKTLTFEEKRNVLKATQGSSIVQYETVEEWKRALGEVLHDDYKTKQFEQWQYTLADVIAAMISVEKNYPALIDRSIYIVDELRLKMEKPHPAARSQRAASVHMNTREFALAA